MIDDETDRRKRAWAGRDERPWSFPESDIRWAMSLSTCSVETTAMLNYLAGAREEAAIHADVLLCLRATYEGRAAFFGQAQADFMLAESAYKDEIAALREAVCEAYVDVGRAECGTLCFAFRAKRTYTMSEEAATAVRRALAEKP